MQVCTHACRKVASIASGNPLRPSTQLIRTSSARVSRPVRPPQPRAAGELQPVGAHAGLPGVELDQKVPARAEELAEPAKEGAWVGADADVAVQQERRPPRCRRELVEHRALDDVRPAAASQADGCVNHVDPQTRDADLVESDRVASRSAADVEHRSGQVRQQAELLSARRREPPGDIDARRAPVRPVQPAVRVVAF